MKIGIKMGRDPQGGSMVIPVNLETGEEIEELRFCSVERSFDAKMQCHIEAFCEIYEEPNK